MNVSTLKSGKFGKFMNVVYAEILLKKNQRNVFCGSTDFTPIERIMEEGMK